MSGFVILWGIYPFSLFLSSPLPSPAQALPPSPTPGGGSAVSAGAAVGAGGLLAGLATSSQGGSGAGPGVLLAMGRESPATAWGGWSWDQIPGQSGFGIRSQLCLEESEQSSSPRSNPDQAP